jgi:ankyrin repeat protein
MNFQIANKDGIKLIINKIGKYIKPVNFLDRFPERFELKDSAILAHLAMFPTDDGKLPIHYAADRGNKFHKYGRMAVLKQLLKVYPEATTVRDGSGLLPLHIAIESRASLSVLEVLLRATNPNAGEAVCRRRDDIMLNFPPVLMAAASDCDLESIFALLRYAPTISNRQVTFVSRKRRSPPA